MHLNSIYSTSFFYKIGPLIILLKQFALGAVNERTTTSRLHFPFRIHEEDNFTSVNLDDVSGKFWLAMNYTYTVVKGNSTHISASEGYFDLKLTRFDVRDGLPDDNFPGELDKVWANDKGWPVNLILSFPDLDASFVIPKSVKPIMRVRLPYTLPSAYFSPIPKIVHSAYISKDVEKHSFETLPHSIQRSITSFNEQNPNYISRFVGSVEDMRKDILDLEGKTVLEAFDTLTPFAYKVDLWRVVMMYHLGGVYSDSKLILSEPLDLLLSSHVFSPDTPQSILVKDRSDYGIMNSFMAMPPGTQYARKAIDGIVENVYNKSYKGGTLGITGPRFLQNEVYNHLEVKDKAFFHFLYVSEDLFDFKNLIQAPGQNEDVEKLEHQRVVIFHNGEYRRHAKSTGSNTYNNNYNNCQVFGEKEPSNLCHQSPESIMENSASNTLNIILLTSLMILVPIFIGC